MPIGPVSVPFVINTLQGGSEPGSILDGNFNALVAAFNNPLTYSNYAVDIGTTNALVATFNPPVTSLQAGLALFVSVLNANTGAVTLNANGTGAKAVVNPDLSALTTGQLKAGSVLLVVYNGTQYVAESFVGFASGVTFVSPTLSNPTISGTITLSGATSWTMLRGLIAGLVPSNTAGSVANKLDFSLGAACASDGITLISLAAAITAKDITVNWTVGSNGGLLDTGVVANTVYHCYLITKSDGTGADVIASTSATFAGVTKPAGYAGGFGRRIFSFSRAGATNQAFTAYELTGGGLRVELLVPVQDFATANPGTSAVVWTTSVPTGFQFVVEVVAIFNNNTNNVQLLITSPDQTDTTPTTNQADIVWNNLGTAYGLSIMRRVVTSTTSTIRYRFAGTTTNVNVAGYSKAWEDSRRQ